MGEHTPQQLLNDARLVLDYAARAGRLPHDALARAVQAAAGHPEQMSIAETSALLAALNDTVRAIAPVTLTELRAGRSPFDRRGQRAARLMQGAFCILAIALTVVVAYLTEFLHREESALKAWQRVEQAYPLDKLSGLRRMIQFESGGKAGGSQFDEYHRGLRELRNVQENVFATYDLLESVVRSGTWLSLRVQGGFSWPSSVAPYDIKRVGARPVAIEPGAPGADGRDVNGPGVDVCEAGAAEAAAHPVQNYAPWLRAAVVDLLDEFCFATRLNLSLNSLNMPPSISLVYQVQQSMAALNGWILPFLYGLLGAVVFVLRDLLSTRTATLSVATAVLRIALGGIAGIIIGWFWTAPASTTAQVTSIPFGLSFLAGFSIEILFSLLDRLNQSLAEVALGKKP